MPEDAEKLLTAAVTRPFHSFQRLKIESPPRLKGHRFEQDCGVSRV